MCRFQTCYVQFAAPNLLASLAAWLASLAQGLHPGTGEALLHGLHGPFYLFLDFGFLLIFDHSQTCVFLSRAIFYFGQRPRLFASNQGAQGCFPICFCVNDACIHPLRFQSNSNLFSTLVQPFVFGFWPWPGCKIVM